MTRFAEWGTELIATLRNSLSARVFVITCGILTLVSTLTYGLIASLMPITYEADDAALLTSQMEELLAELESSTLEECPALLGDFAVRWNRTISVEDMDGATIAGAVLLDDDLDPLLPDTAQAFDSAGDAVNTCIGAEFTFRDSPELYRLLVVASTQPVNQATAALANIWPWLLVAVLATSVCTSFFYSHYITRPIVRLSRVSEKLSNLDFGWTCDVTRSDEIGTLARSLDTLARRLSEALNELRAANSALAEDIQRERQREQAQRDLFSAISHELKTPITIIRGQLQGMLDGIGMYANRDKYLARCLQVVEQLETLVQETVLVARLDADTPTARVPVDMGALLSNCLEEYEPLFEQKNQDIILDLAAVPSLSGEALLLRKAVSNLLANASAYSPPGAELRISLAPHEGGILLSVENANAQIDPRKLPHVFEPFQRGDPSRNRSTGGSGLGLFLVDRIAQRHDGWSRIHNTERGVLAELYLPVSTQSTHKRHRSSQKA